MGIAKDKLPLLFREFTQADPSVSRRFGGTGLGLSICKKLVELFGGDINVSSIEGSGSTFSFTARFEPGQVVAATQETCLDAVCPEKLRVLVVDDDPINNAVAKRYIEKQGHEVVCATTGKAAVDLAADGDFDIALLDLGLTDMDGYEACRRIRMATSARVDGELPVAAMTARVESGVRAACAAVGMITCLPKPLVPSALDELFERIGTKARQLGPRAAATVQAPAASVAERSKAPRPEAPGTPLVNVSDLLERLDEDEAFMLELLGIFVEETPGRLASFEAAKGKRDLEALQKQGHALKGSALSLCANPVGAAAGTLEAACIAAKRTGFDLETLFPPILSALDEVERLLEDTAAESAAIISRSKG
jgi:CheY-like chemotaxis protein